MPPSKHKASCQSEVMLPPTAFAILYELIPRVLKEDITSPDTEQTTAADTGSWRTAPAEWSMDEGRAWADWVWVAAVESTVCFARKLCVVKPGEPAHNQLLEESLRKAASGLANHPALNSLTNPGLISRMNGAAIPLTNPEGPVSVSSLRHHPEWSSFVNSGWSALLNGAAIPLSNPEGSSSASSLAHCPAFIHFPNSSLLSLMNPEVTFLTKKECSSSMPKTETTFSMNGAPSDVSGTTLCEGESKAKEDCKEPQGDKFMEQSSGKAKTAQSGTTGGHATREKDATLMVHILNKKIQIATNLAVRSENLMLTLTRWCRSQHFESASRDGSISWQAKVFGDALHCHAGDTLMPGYVPEVQAIARLAASLINEPYARSVSKILSRSSDHAAQYHHPDAFVPVDDTWTGPTSSTGSRGPY